MKSRLEIWRYWCKHRQNNILYKLLVLLKLRHSPSFEFLYIRETCKEKYGCSPFAEDYIDPRLIKRISPRYKLKESVDLANLNVRRIDILKVINITNARKDLYNLIQKVNENSEPVLITGIEGNAVLISEGDWNSICETMHLKSIPGMEESLLKGKESSLSDCITEEKIEEISETDECVAVMR